MRNIICVCNTYFQLIVTVQLKLTLFCDDKVSVALSDHAGSAREVFERLEGLEIFDRCVYIRTKGRDPVNPGKMDELKKVSSFISGRDDIWDPLGSASFDEMVFFNQRNSILTLFARLYEKNRSIEVSRFEEGIFTYDGGDMEEAKGTAKLRRALGKKSMEQCFARFYCFYPELYHGTMDVRQIPKIDAAGPISVILDRLFEINIPADAYDPYKYIFFAGADPSDGGPDMELQLIKETAERVGRENLLVKAHPRDDIRRFTSEGLSVDPNSKIPWEAIQLGRNFDGHVFLSIHSASVMTVSLLQDNPPEIFYLYNLGDFRENKTVWRMVEPVRRLLHDDFITKGGYAIHEAGCLSDIPV